MTALADLHKAVQTTLASQRLGRPVFVRLILQGNDGPEAALAKLGRLSALVCDWLGQPPQRVYAVGSLADGPVSVTWQFADGATASVSCGRGSRLGDGLDVLVLGNHGALYHDAGDANLWDDPLTVEAGPAEMKTLIERALKSGKPEVVAKP
jgi:hypothetical protein